MRICLTVLIQSKPAHAAGMRSILEELDTASLQEAACLRYDLHQAAADPCLFILHEEWADEAGLEWHSRQPYLQKFMEVSAAMTDRPVVIYQTRKLVPSTCAIP